MQQSISKKQISPTFDPWEAYLDIEEYGELKLTNVEFTTSTICNMRCGHCAVGHTLQVKDPQGLPTKLLLDRLEEVEHLRSISITGGEPLLSKQTINEYVLPLLKYANSRGIYTQINSNLTIDIERYEEIAPYIDVLHISHNWGTVDEFVHYGFERMDRKPSFEQRAAYLEKMFENANILSKAGVFLSAETMLNKRTLPHLEKIHKEVIEIGCQRHEIHPMYPSDFAAELEALSLDEIKHSIRHLLDIRNQDLWMLFGTLPIYACNDSAVDLELLQRLAREKNVTVRNDPDGRSRLNVNVFTGDIIVTDFGDEPSFGNIQETSLQKAYDTWGQTKTAKSLSCHCPTVKCLGPNLLVKDMYYKNIDFTNRKAN